MGKGTLRKNVARFLIPLATLLGFNAHANEINGVWEQVDDNGRVNSLVSINVVKGEAQATILKGFARPGRELDPNARCKVCPGEFQDKPLIGLRFMWGLKADGRNWDGGQILDPDEGKIYRARATLSDDGETLQVRGYLGISLFGRTQAWRRYKGNIE